MTERELVLKRALFIVAISNLLVDQMVDEEGDEVV